MTQKTASQTIRYVSWMLILFSTVWGLAAFPPLDIGARFLVDMLDWPYGDGSPGWGRSVMWLSSIGAGLLMGLAVIFLLIVAPALQNGDRPIVRSGLWAVVAWFIVDSAGSIASGVTSNAIVNIAMLVLLAGPLVLVKFES